MTKKIVVIGGSAAGPKAAAKAKRMDQSAEVTLIQDGPDFSMASCGYPYYVGGFFDDRNGLLSTPTGVVRDTKYYLRSKGIKAFANTRALSIERETKKINCLNRKDNSTFELEYDKLIIATGASPVVPPLPGHELEGITTLQSMRDADYLRKIADDKKIKKAVVIGGGLIGVETCEALNLAGIDITLVEMLPQILMFLDPELAKLLENHIRAKGSLIITENPIVKFLGEDGVLTGVKLKNGTELPCELAVVAVGVRPNTALAANAGLEIGETRGIAVNDFMQTSDENIYAVGDCIEITNRITGKKVLAPYGDLANLEGRVAGRNAAAGNEVKFPGTLQTGVCKVFDYSAGATGLSETNARKLGYDVTAVLHAGPDKPSFMGGKLLVLKMVVETKTGKLLGLQAVGPGEVSKRIAEAAMAIQGGLTVSDITTSDLPYAPPFSPAIDNFITTAHIMENKLEGRMSGISAIKVKEMLHNREEMFLLDVRSPVEYEAMRLGEGATLMPLGTISDRLDELPQDKDALIITFCKSSARAYEAETVLRRHGWTNVNILEGGLIAWPFKREK